MAMAAALIGCPPTEEAVKISFSANGGVGTMADQDATVGMETVLNANEFDRAGYEFDGWNEVADGSGKSYADKGKITVSAAVKLYAQWKPAPLQNFAAVGANAAVILTWELVQIPYEEISITYDGASEAVKVTPQNKPNDTVTISGLENDKPYTFTAVVTADGKTSREATVKGTPSLANSPVTVTFHSNPPTDLEEQDSYTQVVTVGEATALESCTFVYDSYEFKGWATSAESTDIAYADGAELTAAAENINSGIDLYAVWVGIQLSSATVSLPAGTGYLIGGTTVVLTETLEPANAYVSRVEVTCDNSGTARYDFDTKTLTLPSNTTGARVDYSVTLTYHTVNESGASTTITANDSTPLTLTVYPETWVVRNGKLYKDVKSYTNFATQSNSEVTYEQNSGSAITGDDTGAVIDVSALANESGTSNAKIIFKNVKNDNSSPSDPVLMELTVVYSKTSDIGAVLALPGESTTPWFWLLRNSFNGNSGDGTAFRVGEYSAAEGAKYTVPENEPFTLGYLFDGADNTNSNSDTTVKFFFNGENKFVPLTNDSRPSDGTQPIKAPSVGSDVTLQLWKETDSADPAEMTIQKAVFYEEAEAATAGAAG